MAELTVNRFFETPLIRQSFACGLEPLAAAVREALAAQDGAVAWHPIDTDVLGPEGAQWTEQMVGLAERFSTDAQGRPPRHVWGLALAARIIPAGSGVAPGWDAGAYWSAILRMSGEEDAGGELIVEDPRMPMRVMHEPGIAFRAPDGGTEDDASVSAALAVGEAMLMPGWLRCGVAPYRGAQPIVELGLSLFARLRGTGGA